LEFLWTHPFRDLTVEALMSPTEASRSAFYQYFADLHDLMEALLRGLQDDILGVAQPWLTGEGDPVPLLQESLAGLVQVCYRQGPLVRAVSDATSTDAKLEQAWTDSLTVFDEAVAARIEEQQAAGLIPEFDARSVAVALNRMDAAVMIQQFGRRPRGDPESVCKSITWIWVSTLYGPKARAQLQEPCLLEKLR
jgi:AcrR family transcriptional regulator